MKIVIVLAVLFFILGCATRNNERITAYDVNCSSCKMIIKYEVNLGDKNLDVKGF